MLFIEVATLATIHLHLAAMYPLNSYGRSKDSVGFFCILVLVFVKYIITQCNMPCVVLHLTSFLPNLKIVMDQMLFYIYN